MILFFESAIIGFIGLFLLFTSITMLLACVCWKKPTQKDDLLGLDGMVKLTNPDENVNHMTPSANNCVPIEVPNHQHTTISFDPSINPEKSNARPSGGSNSNRSLPDIPRIAEPGLESVTADTNSEIYATVEDKIAAQPLTQNYMNGDYRANLVSTTENNIARPSLSQQSSLSQADAPYARLKSEHPYDKLKKEHPYASVQKNEASTSIQIVDRNSNDILLTIPHSPVVQRASTSSLGITDHPIAPPRSRRASSHLSLQSISTTDIPAATAVAGRVAASQDLPYMTPPTVQQNFSGDSQDSSKGYTSISVREPLANILAQTQTVSNRVTRRQELTDPHYATVSDDSDEMYAAIEEPNHQIYTSGSETYAQIQPNPVQPLPPLPEPQNDIITLQVNATIEHRETPSSGGKSPAPQPPSVDSLRQVAQVHSRQASSSSCTSSIANIGSPKPEKRQANSPLPPRPEMSPEPRTSNVSRNLEDMYAKVHKNGKKKVQEDRRSSAGDNRNSIQSIGKTWTSRESINMEPEVKKLSPSKSISNISQRSLPPVVFDLSGPESLLSNDPGYEVLHKASRPPSDCDPNYEVLKPTKPLYSSIHKKNRTDPGYESVKPKIGDEEPNYESMPSDCEPAYASVAGGKCNGSETDSNYSSNDPNYERVKYKKYLDQVENNVNRNSLEGSESYYSNIPGYERVGGNVEDICNNSERTSSPGGKYKVDYDTIGRRGSTIIEEAVFKI